MIDGINARFIQIDTKSGYKVRGNYSKDKSALINLDNVNKIQLDKNNKELKITYANGEDDTFAFNKDEAAPEDIKEVLDKSANGALNYFA